MNATLKETILRQEIKVLEAVSNDLTEKNRELNEIINTVIAENKELEIKNAYLMEIVEGLEKEVVTLDEECNRLSDELEEEDSQVIHYIAVSLDLELCVPLVSENPIQAGQELINKCLAKGVPYGGFKVFEKSELL